MTRAYLRNRSRHPAGRASQKRRSVVAVGTLGGFFGFGVAGVLLAFWIYGPALFGEFVSDDLFYIKDNAYIRSLAPADLLALFEPGGPSTVWTLNYAPVHLIALALEWRWFGSEPYGYHVVNVWLHVLVSALVVVFLGRTGLGAAAALLGGLFFLVHPANVEAVSWSFQSKTLLSTGLALGALICFDRLPGFSTGLFLLALLTKVSASFALPVLGVMIWCGSPRVDGLRGRWVWLAVWTLVFFIVAWPVWATVDRIALAGAHVYPDVWTHARAMLAVTGRYAVMAATSYGVSAFQKPSMDVSLGDPWWLLGALVVAVLGVRWLTALRAGRPEAVHWTLAAAALVPVSQLVPLPYPVADRYLYAMLPGLIGGTFLALRGPLERLDARAGRLDAPGKRLASLAARVGVPAVRPVHAVAAALVLVVCAGFAVRSHDRAALWRTAHAVMLDAAAHYPDGTEAHLIDAYEAARVGDAVASAASLRSAYERGFVQFSMPLVNPVYASVREHPDFDAVLDDMAGWWIQRAAEVEQPTQRQLEAFANAHYVRGELDESIALLERALEVGGPADEAFARTLDRRRLEGRLRDRLR